MTRSGRNRHRILQRLPSLQQSTGPSKSTHGNESIPRGYPYLASQRKVPSFSILSDHLSSLIRFGNLSVGRNTSPVTQNRMPDCDVLNARMFFSDEVNRMLQTLRKSISFGLKFIPAMLELTMPSIVD